MYCKLITRLMPLDFQYLTIRSSKFSTECKERWDLVSSVCLQRIPIITKDFSDIELKYDQVINQIEYEMSYKSDHEVRKMKDKLLAEQLKKDGGFIDSDKATTGTLQTAQEIEDTYNAEFKQFKFANRSTEEDTTNNTKSINRKLSESLYLVIRQNIGEKSAWVLPQTTRKEGETMRQAAERVLKEVCGHSLHTKVLSNAPCGFYKYKYPKKANIPQSVGMKVFFFKALLFNKNISEIVSSDFQWLTHNELEILPEDYRKSIRTFIIDNE